MLHISQVNVYYIVFSYAVQVFQKSVWKGTYIQHRNLKGIFSHPVDKQRQESRQSVTLSNYFK